MLGIELHVQRYDTFASFDVYSLLPSIARARALLTVGLSEEDPDP